MSALLVRVSPVPRRTLLTALAVFFLALAGSLGAFATAAQAAAPLDLDTLSGTEAEAMLEAGEINSVELTEDYLERIESLNKAGPGLNAVTQINKYALAEAAKADSERAVGIDLGPAMGLPILLKDIIDAKGMYTSAGDWALRDSYPEKDSGVAKELRAHGVIVLGKLGLSEWANSFGSQPSGFSNLTGQVLNALDAAQGPSGSSSGSGAAASSAMAALTIGTETSGSIISPSTSQGDVGMRPTLGLVPGYGIAPIDASQDTAGPIVRTVSDAAITLQSIAEVTGTDPEANAEYEGMMGPHFLENEDIQPAPFTKLPDYLDALDPEFVKNKRIGYNGTSEAVLKAKAALEAAGATMVLDEAPESSKIPALPPLPSGYEAHATINEYYEHLGADAPVKSLEQEVAVDNTNPQEGEKDGNSAHASESLAEITPGGANQKAYEEALPKRKTIYHATIEQMMKEPKVAGVAVTPVLPVIAVIGSVPSGPQAGDPEIAVPMGYSATQRRNMAVDVNGGAYDDYNLLGVAYVIEQGTHGREAAADVNPSAYRCAHTASNVTPEPFAGRGHCNPDYVALMKMLGGTPKLLPFSLETTSATELETKLEEGTLTSEELVKAELYRAALTNDNGPAVQALRAVAPGAIAAAIESDKRRKRGRSKGAFDGIPVVVDDSINVKGLATSAGSVALQDNVATTNATLVKNLEEQGSIILGDTNTTEFDGAMEALEGSNMPSGYSSLGGQVLLPSDTNTHIGGSSAGSAAAVSMGLAPLAVGMETSTEAAQMLLPAGNAGVVALKPTVGLVSTEGVLPVAKSQDSPGPIAQTVKDVGTELELLTGKTGGVYTAESLYKATNLFNKSIAVIPPATAEATKEPSKRSNGEQLYITAKNELNNLGANLTTVTPGTPTSAPSVIPYEFHVGLNKYLAESPNAGAKSLAEVIAYNEAHKTEALKFRQESLVAAEAIEPADATTKTAYEGNLTKGQTEDEAVINNIITKGTLETGDDYSAIMVPQGSPLVGVADRAGYPVLTLPAGFAVQNSSTGGDPVGVDLIGAKESEATLLADGYALEQGLKARQLGPEFMRAANPSVSGAPSETNQSMFRCVAGSAFYKPYDCNPGEVGFNALKIAGEGKLETPGAPVTGGGGGGSGTTPTPPSAPSSRSPKPKPKVELLGTAHVTGNGKATIKIHVSGAGTATVTGSDIKPVVITVRKAGTVTLSITLKPAEKRALAAKGKVKVTVKVAFVATDGAKTTKTLKLTLVGKD
ncbi:MAG TPA: amidase family protein [Solirubrobacterales bacterium]|nr:amidase family protein [Solirubrobacterales bacterium]